jgi:hypothetical protein
MLLLEVSFPKKDSPQTDPELGETNDHVVERRIQRTHRQSRAPAAAPRCGASIELLSEASWLLDAPVSVPSAPTKGLGRDKDPHQYGLAPGPVSPRERPGDYLERSFRSVPSDITRKVLHDNAAASNNTYIEARGT